MHRLLQTLLPRGAFIIEVIAIITAADIAVALESETRKTADAVIELEL
jgi:hypothetical protein